MSSIYSNAYYANRFPGQTPAQIKSEIETQRRSGLTRLVESEYASGKPNDGQTIDGRAAPGFQAGAATIAGLAAVGVGAAWIIQANPAPAGAPTAGAGINPTGAPTERLSISPADRIGQTAKGAVAEAHGRGVAKKIDTFARATPANKFTDPSTRGGDALFNRGPRLDVRARAGQDPTYNEGGQIDGRGPDNIFGRRAPPIPARMAVPQPKA